MSEKPSSEARDSQPLATKSSVYNLTPVYGFTSGIAPGLFVAYPIEVLNDAV